MANIRINMDSLKPGREWKRHKIVDGNNIYRILPPFGDPELHKNIPFKKWTIVWGLIDLESGKMKPLNSPINSPEKKCPVRDYLDLLTDKVEQLTKQYEDQGMDEEQIKNKLSKVNKLLWEIRPKTVYSYNACDKSGAIGILDLKPTAHKAMKRQMMEYINDYCQDPTALSSDEDDSGVWFNITREGIGKATEYNVKISSTREKDERGRLVAVDDRSPLPENVVKKYDEIGYDLQNLYITKSYDELKELLILNLNNIIKDIPEAKIDGFYIEDAPVLTKVKTTEVEPVVKTVKAKKHVNISLDTDDDDDDDDGDTRVKRIATPKVETNILSDDDDLMAMAENILNS